MHERVLIIGGGLAGCEAAWQLSKFGIPSTIYEMRPILKTDAHVTDKLCELVCSNSFRSDNFNTSAIGLLHEEMRKANSLIFKVADKCRVPAGEALAVDRKKFSEYVQNYIYLNPLIKVIRKEIKQCINEDWRNTIIASGPLTSSSLANNITKLTGSNGLYFFDAIAPIIYKESINMDVAWYQSRYNKTGTLGDKNSYINCPLDKYTYENFVKKVLEAETTKFHEWETKTPYFESCLPIEVLSARGINTLRFGPMKPVGLIDPNTNLQPYAVVQLRQDNSLATLYNIVGFQTKIKYQSQTNIFKMIPGLEDAKFARLGGIHRNTYINSPLLLDNKLRLHSNKSIRFAGQITGVEGYVESAATGLLAGVFCAAEIKNKFIPNPPNTSALGSLLNYITDKNKTSSFQPMNINFGLFHVENKNLEKKEKRKIISLEALKSINIWQQKVSKTLLSNTTDIS